MSLEDSLYLRPTAILDSDHPRIAAFARQSAGQVTDPVEQAVRIYYAVRDGIRYDPYYPFYLPEHYRASNVLASGRGYCVCKASLLCALGRSLGIPSRVGFATVRNHLATKQLIEFIGSDLFVYHGYTDFFLEGKWVKATPAFNKELCVRHRVAPLEFDGREDSIFQPFNRKTTGLWNTWTSSAPMTTSRWERLSSPGKKPTAAIGSGAGSPVSSPRNRSGISIERK